MRRILLPLLMVELLFISSGVLLAQSGTCNGMSVSQGASLNGFVPFPSSNLWNTDISAAPVDPNSDNIINFIGSTVTLHPDFGAGTFQRQTIGIPYQVVDTATQAMVNVTLGLYADESDPGPMPIPSNALIVGYPKPGNGARPVLTALKRYGMILADNGSAVFISGVPDDRWNNTDLNMLKTITASNFEVVQMGTIYTDANVPTGPSPTISSFTASATSVTSGTPVTLSWNESGAIYNIISPTVGPVRGASGSVTVFPTATTTYTFYATNQYGRTTQSVTVTVH